MIDRIIILLCVWGMAVLLEAWLFVWIIMSDRGWKWFVRFMKLENHDTE